MRWQALRGQGVGSEKEDSVSEAEPKDTQALFEEDCCESITHTEQRVSSRSLLWVIKCGRCLQHSHAELCLFSSSQGSTC